MMAAQRVPWRRLVVADEEGRPARHKRCCEQRSGPAHTGSLIESNVAGATLRRDVTPDQPVAAGPVNRKRGPVRAARALAGELSG